MELFTLNAWSLFSGVGGMDAGLARAGVRHSLFCESDAWRRDVLRARFPGVPVYDDVRSVGAADVRLADGRGRRHELEGRLAGVDARQAGTDASSVGVQDARGVDPPDLLCGGFPCQDVSVAGKRAGLAGNRSGLFHEFARIADLVRPRWLLVENVPGLLSSNGGRDFGVVLGTLADLGYGVAWRILDSRFFGVPQRRRRVFVVGCFADGDPRAAAECAGAVLAVGSRCAGHSSARGEAGADVAVASLSGLGSGGPDDNDAQAGRVIAATLKGQRGRGGGGIGPEETLIAAPLSHGSNPNSNAAGRRREDDYNLVPIAGPLGGGNDGIGRRTKDDPNLVAYALNAKAGYHDGDADTTYVPGEASVRRLTPTECERLQGLPDGWTLLDAKTPDSRRYAALGDAVTANVAEWIGRRLVAA